MEDTIPEPNDLPEITKLSVCMIVRNEEEALPRCLQSVESVANELIVVDTGSKDRTVSIAKDFGAKLFHFEWCDDFAAARNESIKNATGDWILQIDADEELDPNSIRWVKSALLKPSIIAYNAKCDNGPTTLTPRFEWICRLFRRLPGVKYERPYHEGVDHSLSNLIRQEPYWQIVREPKIVIRHHGYEGPQLEIASLRKEL
ncbi:MAG: glycosyltransferase family 2 protein [Deltaproteobacteria bacterium]|nr:glycosyltransferase family 2 protein [Deltaproteobacteria bacterium]